MPFRAGEWRGRTGPPDGQAVPTGTCQGPFLGIEVVTALKPDRKGWCFPWTTREKQENKDSGSTFLWYSVALTFPFQAQHLLEPPRLSQGGSPGDPRAQGRREGQSCWNREASWCSSFKRIKRHKIQFCHLELVMNYTHLGFMVGFSSLAYDIYCSAFDSSLWESQPRDREVGARPLCWGPCMWRDDPPQRNPLQSDQLELSLASLECAGTGRALASFDVRSLKNLIRFEADDQEDTPSECEKSQEQDASHVWNSFESEGKNALQKVNPYWVFHWFGEETRWLAGVAAEVQPSETTSLYRLVQSLVECRSGGNLCRRLCRELGNFMNLVGAASHNSDKL